MNNIVRSLSLIVENPFSKKGYLELKKIVVQEGRQSDAEALQYLIDKRFSHDLSDSHSDQEQRTDN